MAFLAESGAASANTQTVTVLFTDLVGSVLPQQSHPVWVNRRNPDGSRSGGACPTAVVFVVEDLDGNTHFVNCWSLTIHAFRSVIVEEPQPQCSAWLGSEG